MHGLHTSAASSWNRYDPRGVVVVVVTAKHGNVLKTNSVPHDQNCMRASERALIHLFLGNFLRHLTQLNSSTASFSAADSARCKGQL